MKPKANVPHIPHVSLSIRQAVCFPIRHVGWVGMCQRGNTLFPVVLSAFSLVKRLHVTSWVIFAMYA